MLVQNITAEIEATISTKVPIHQLILPLSHGLSMCLNSDEGGWEKAKSILKLMKVVTDSSQRSALSPVICKIFNGLVLAYGYKGDEVGRNELLQIANSCLLSLVMKLSEAQLHTLYACFCEWRGDINGEGDSELSSSIRRHTFWDLSATLCKPLWSIFLPCMTSVLTDIIDKLVRFLVHTKIADLSELFYFVLCRELRYPFCANALRSRANKIDDVWKFLTSLLKIQKMTCCLCSVFY